MTQKELLYVEDAISHEQIIIDELSIFIKELSDSSYQDFIRDEIDIHLSLKNDLISLLKEES
jgi:hypothetical protein